MVPRTLSTVSEKNLFDCTTQEQEIEKGKKEQMQSFFKKYFEFLTKSLHKDLQFYRFLCLTIISKKCQVNIQKIVKKPRIVLLYNAIISFKCLHFLYNLSMQIRHRIAI
jgi:RNA recognition motif-containing protein